MRFKVYKYLRGITLIEVLVYIALLGMLFSSTFSIVFTIGKSGSYVQKNAEKQIYSIAFLEFTRSLLSDGEKLIEPTMLATSSRAVTEAGILENEINNGQNSGYFYNGNNFQHSFIFVPQNMIFSRVSTTTVDILGEFFIRASSSRDFIMPVNTWKKH